MKTAINQSATVLSLFTLAFGATLTIAWGMTEIIYPSQKAIKKPINRALILQVEKKAQQDITRAFKYLIPKLK